MWENYRQAALNLRRFALVLNATGELLNLKEKAVDIPILALLTEEAIDRMNAVPANTPKKDIDTSTRKFCERLEMLLKSVSTTVVENPKFWQIYASWHAAKGEWTAELECRRKVLRCAQLGSWHTESDLFLVVCVCCVCECEKPLNPYP